jgi:hypothetical protein
MGLDWDAIRAWVPIAISVAALVLSGLTFVTARRWRPRPFVILESDQMMTGGGALQYREIVVSNRGNAPVHDFGVDASWGMGDLGLPFGISDTLGTLGSDKRVVIRLGTGVPLAGGGDHEMSLKVPRPLLGETTVKVTWREPPNFKRLRSLPLGLQTGKSGQA